MAKQMSELAHWGLLHDIDSLRRPYELDKSGPYPIRSTHHDQHPNQLGVPTSERPPNSHASPRNY